MTCPLLRTLIGFPAVLALAACGDQPEPDPWAGAADPPALVAAEALASAAQVFDGSLDAAIGHAVTELDGPMLEQTLTTLAQVRGSTAAHLTTLRASDPNDFQERQNVDVLEEGRRLDLRIADWFADDLADDPELDIVYDEDGRPVPLAELDSSSSDLMILSRVLFAAEALWNDRTGEPLSFASSYLTPYRDALSDAASLRRAPLR